MLRITGGEFRGRMIETPANQRTRPTQSRLRQALFNSLQFQISESKVLDLFAGSGSLGFEALSRGASQVVSVEESKTAAQLIYKNAQTLKVESRISVLQMDVQSSFSRLQKTGPFDLILADPPYEAGWEIKLLETFPWSQLLAKEGFFCLEWGVQKSQVTILPDQVPFLVKVREKNYGDSILTTYKKLE